LVAVEAVVPAMEVQAARVLSFFPTVLSWKSPALQQPLEQVVISLKLFKSLRAMVRLNMTSPSPQLARC
jgi:hypothetical protein